MFSFLKYLEAADDLVDDKAELREFGLNDEEVDGYEEFFFSSYFPIVEEII